jgi:hypothetical protein
MLSSIFSGVVVYTAEEVRNCRRSNEVMIAPCHFIPPTNGLCNNMLQILHSADKIGLQAAVVCLQANF